MSNRDRIVEVVARALCRLATVDSDVSQSLGDMLDRVAERNYSPANQEWYRRDAREIVDAIGIAVPELREVLDHE